MDNCINVVRDVLLFNTQTLDYGGFLFFEIVSCPDLFAFLIFPIPAFRTQCFFIPAPEYFQTIAAMEFLCRQVSVLDFGLYAFEDLKQFRIC